MAADPPVSDYTSKCHPSHPKATLCKAQKNCKRFLQTFQASVSKLNVKVNKTIIACLDKSFSIQISKVCLGFQDQCLWDRRDMLEIFHSTIFAEEEMKLNCPKTTYANSETRRRSDDYLVLLWSHRSRAACSGVLTMSSSNYCRGKSEIICRRAKALPKEEDLFNWL